MVWFGIRFGLLIALGGALLSVVLAVGWVVLLFVGAVRLVLKPFGLPRKSNKPSKPKFEQTKSNIGRVIREKIQEARQKKQS